MKEFIYKIKRFFWLIAAFIFRVVFAHKYMKAPLLKTLYYNFHGGFTGNQVTLYNLNKGNKNEYLSEFDWFKSRKINYPYGYMLDDKVLCAEIIKDYVNVPDTLFKKSNGSLTSNDEVITIKEAIDLIEFKKSVFFKPISVGKGTGVIRIDYKNKRFYIDTKRVKENDVVSILENSDNYFVSSAIEQAKYLRDIYNDTSNTIRIITGRGKNNKVKILCAVQRFGTSETIPVDNGSRGGLVSNIDLETGKLSEVRSIHNTNVYEKHPDSEVLIKGKVIPNWENISKDVLSLSEKLTDLKFIAWDILPTDDGFYVIEANSSSGVNIIQVFGGQRHKALGNFYREYGIIK